MECDNKMVVNLISENPYSPSPRGHLGEFEIIGREEITIDIWDFIYQASKTKFIPSIIRAPYGGGKTTYLKWLTKNLQIPANRPSYLNNVNLLTAYTRLAHPSIESIVEDFLNTIKNEIQKNKRAQFLKHLDEIITELDKKRIVKNNYYYSILYRNILDLLYNQNIDVIIHIIDEYEAISEMPPEESRGFLHEFRDFIDEVDERPILMILGCTDEAYRLMEEIHPALISRIPEDFKKNIVVKLNFTFENTLDFISKRLEAVRVKNLDQNNPYYPFTRKIIEIIYNKSGGNIRTIEQTCYFALDYSIKNDAEINETVILDAIHKVINEKRGSEKTESIYNLIDDPKERETFTNKIQGGNPEDLKTLLYSGFKNFLSKQNFDYQFQFDSDIFGENVALVQINTHAFRSTPINLTFFCSTIPKDLGHSDFIDAEKIRTYYNASMCTILRIVEDEKSLTIKDNIIEICIPWKHLEELSILSHVSNLDVSRISQKIEDEYNIISNINNWITSKNEQGNIIGNRFKQYEVTIYKLLWRMGNDPLTLDEIYQHSRKTNKKYTKITLTARLTSLQEKKLVNFNSGKYGWGISPLMKQIFTIISEIFENNPIMPLDLIKHFMGGSKGMLRKYMELMTAIGILEIIKVGRSSAFKIAYSMEDVENCVQNKKELNEFLSEYTELPKVTTEKINQYRRELQNSFEYINNNEKNEMKIYANIYRIYHIFTEIKEYITKISNDSVMLKNKHENLLTEISNINNKIITCFDLDLDVEAYHKKIEEIERNVKHLYEIEYYEKGRMPEVLNKYDEYEVELEQIRKNIDKLYTIHEKLLLDIAKSEKIVLSITQMEGVGDLQDETISEISNNLTNAKKSLNNKEYTMTEFYLLKILQNINITKINYDYNITISELGITIKELSEIAKITTRFNPSVNYLIELQNIDSYLKQAKEELEIYNLIKVNKILEETSKQIDILRYETIKEIITWFSEIMDREKHTSPQEISKNWDIPFNTVLQAIMILLKNNKISVVWK